mgnify:CR=1 FL=1
MIRNKLSALMGERLVRISKLAKMTGLSRATVTLIYYRKTKSIDFRTLDKLCEALNCNVEDIIEYRRQKPE